MQEQLLPSVTYDVRTRLWTVTKMFTYGGYGYRVVIPEGFTTDLASIPRIIWPLIAPFELSLAAPLVHDYLYRYTGKISGRKVTRDETDLLFSKIMKDEGVAWWRRAGAYRAVRLFSARFWKD